MTVSHPQGYGKDEVAVIKDMMRKRGRETNDGSFARIYEVCVMYANVRILN